MYKVGKDQFRNGGADLPYVCCQVIDRSVERNKKPLSIKILISLIKNLTLQTKHNHCLTKEPLVHDDTHNIFVTWPGHTRRGDII